MHRQVATDRMQLDCSKFYWIAALRTGVIHKKKSIDMTSLVILTHHACCCTSATLVVINWGKTDLMVGTRFTNILVCDQSIRRRRQTRALTFDSIFIHCRILAVLLNRLL